MELTVLKRDKTGSGYARRSVREGRITGVIYGHLYESVNVELDAHEFLKFIRDGMGDSKLFDISIVEEIGGKPLSTEKGIIKTVQRHPVTNKVQHIDFYRVNMEEKVDVDVAIELTGVCPGVKVGGVLEKRVNTVAIRCLPSDIPDALVVDLSQLEIGDSFHVKDFKVPESVEIMMDEERTIVVISQPQAIETPAADEGEAVAAEGAETTAAGDEDKKEDKPENKKE